MIYEYFCICLLTSIGVIYAQSTQSLNSKAYLFLLIFTQHFSSLHKLVMKSASFQACFEILAIIQALLNLVSQYFIVPKWNHKVIIFKLTAFLSHILRFSEATYYFSLHHKLGEIFQFHPETTYTQVTEEQWFTVAPNRAFGNQIIIERPNWENLSIHLTGAATNPWIRFVLNWKWI